MQCNAMRWHGMARHEQGLAWHGMGEVIKVDSWLAGWFVGSLLAFACFSTHKLSWKTQTNSCCWGLFHALTRVHTNFRIKNFVHHLWEQQRELLIQSTLFFFFQSHIQLHCVQLTILFESSFFIISKIHLNSHYHSHNVKNHLGFYSFAFLFLFPFCFCSSLIYFFIFFVHLFFCFCFNLLYNNSQRCSMIFMKTHT